jgi:hypothetical protein
LKSLTLLWREIAQEMGDWCCTSTTRDFKTVTSRVEHEGESFLTITLPSFCSDFQKSLARGFVDRDQFQGFPFTGSLPRFLGGFFDLVFDRVTGRLVDDPSIDAISAIRQLTLMFGKIKKPTTKLRDRAAIQGFIDCEQSVKESDARRGLQETEEFHRMSVLLWADLFTEIDRRVAYGEIRPKHGPGSTAEKILGNQKYLQTEWTDRLEKVFPAGDFLLPNWGFFDNLNQINWLEPGKERPVRVVTVPKTMKTPRIIAIEPVAMQYAQQGLLEAFEEVIGTDDTGRNFIRFKYQEPNQLLAKEGSITGKLATLDLSEASDRVSNQLVRTLLRNHPHLQDAVDATRSRRADVRGHGVIRLAKFASMGSALCFPMESIVFLTTIFLGIQDELNRPLTRGDIKSLKGQVRVYGDDIIVPVEYVRSVVSRLETFGFKVNAGKSFWTGKFRESCGKDFYDGHDVSVTRVRRELPTQRNSVEEIISTVSLRNQLYKRGLWQSVRWLDELMERVIPFPAVLPTSPVLGKYSFLGHETQKMCPFLQRPLVRGYVEDSLAPKSPLDDAGALLKFFLKRSEEPFVDRNHLERYGRPEAVNIKLRLASAI